MNHYEVRGSKPNPESQSGWRRHIVCQVVAESLQKAVQMTLDAHPDAELHAVSHCGMVVMGQPFIVSRGLSREAI